MEQNRDQEMKQTDSITRNKNRRLLKYILGLRRPERRDLVALMIFFIGVLFICNGIKMGEVQVLWQKAIRICLECIGIG